MSPLTAWRFRQCPECKTTRAASEYRVVGRYRAGWKARGSGIRYRCPGCGHEDWVNRFATVRT
jgi:hypothetical protein